MEIKDIVPEGYKLVSSQKGDLNKNGLDDALVLVEEVGNTSMVLGQGAKRKLLVVVANAAGGYELARSNDKIVPCNTCGGVSGDPFGYMKIDAPGIFRLVVEGGSRERWSFEYLFSFDTQKQDWIAEKIEMETVDEQDGRVVNKTLTGAEIPERRFETIDPEKLVQPVIE
ncbi:hypothetical protein EBB59_08585 [Lysobacter pythonis]|uniref:Uncharacterized protein n=2 Tax=Solilutibacter pythonis TaxID=2483112 RepID=A0A3M2HRV7_9GAMM|nr:hypothetical protein EBB59_08585 [Lysobacter pythonis]